MTVKIITDSLSDFTDEMAREFGVTVVPLTVLFGHETFLDRVTISTEQFYHRLTHDSTWPTTTQPTPAAFAQVYDKLGEEANELLVVTLSSRLSGTYESATNARNLAKTKARIEVIDSRTVVMGLGLIVIAVAKIAQKGADLDTLAAFVRRAMTRSHPIMYFDTLKYLAKGGRIGKAQGMLGSLLSVKPILTMQDGEVSPVTRVRSRGAGMDYLYNFVAQRLPNISELAVEHGNTPEDADALVERLSAIYPKERIYRSTISPVVGVYAGPSIVSVSVLEAEEK